MFGQQRRAAANHPCTHTVPSWMYATCQEPTKTSVAQDHRRVVSFLRRCFPASVHAAPSRRPELAARQKRRLGKTRGTAMGGWVSPSVGRRNVAARSIESRKGAAAVTFTSFTVSFSSNFFLFTSSLSFGPTTSHISEMDETPACV